MAYYPNLSAEMARTGITAADIAAEVEKSPETVRNWMRGDAGGFPVAGAMRVQARWFPKLSVEYLFSTEPIFAAEASSVDAA